VSFGCPLVRHAVAGSSARFRFGVADGRLRRRPRGSRQQRRGVHLRTPVRTQDQRQGGSTQVGRGTALPSRGHRAALAAHEVSRPTRSCCWPIGLTSGAGWSSDRWEKLADVMCFRFCPPVTFDRMRIRGRRWSASIASTRCHSLAGSTSWYIPPRKMRLAHQTRRSARW
jgi:hypothetical protein